MACRGQFAIICDSACDLPAEWLEDAGVFVVPLHTRIGSFDYADYVSIDPVDFYIELASSSKVPQTSHPSPAEFAAAYARALEAGYTTLVSVHSSSALTGSYHAALIAARDAAKEAEVQVFDTLAISAAFGFVVEDLVRLRDAGKTSDEALSHARLVASAAKIGLIPSQDASISSTGKMGNALARRMRRISRSISGASELLEVDAQGRLRKAASSASISVLGGHLIREMSIASRTAGPMAYVEINAGMPRTLAELVKPFDTNEFAKTRIRICNMSSALTAQFGLGAVGVAYLPAALLGIQVTGDSDTMVFSLDELSNKKHLPPQGGTMAETCDVLLLGAGGREHALLTKLAASPLAGKLYVAPGNAGMYELAERVELDMCNPQAVAEKSLELGCGLVVIGPEAPLVAGVADAVSAAGIAVFGPNKAAAQMEGSKEFAKQIMQRAGVPTAAYRAFQDEAQASAYVHEIAGPCVVKADGLAAGKGVIVAQSEEEALLGVHECFTAFGDAGNTVVIEELLKGPEVSLLALTDGVHVAPLATSQDHKRALEGDKGPNTGGMGVYSPVPFVTQAELDEMVAIEQAVVDQLRSEGIVYKGCLYGGFMLTKDGPKVLEFNARFGDPETQVVLPRLESDLLKLMLDIDAGTLDPTELAWSDLWCVSVVLTSAGYPGAYETGKPISGIEEAQALDGVQVYQAGTKLLEDGRVATAGGRVLNVGALATSFEAARAQAYAACEKIDFEGKTYRSDIGLRALRGRDAWEV